MTAPSLPAPWRAFFGLQHLQIQRFGTTDADDAEHATTLALSDARRATKPAYLAYNALRDARRIRERRRIVVPLSALRSAEADPGEVDDDTIEDGVDFRVDYARRHSDQPDEIATANDIKAVLRQRLSRIANAWECLDGLLNGETESITAIRLGVRRHRVSAIRALIRQITKEIVGEEVAA